MGRRIDAENLARTALKPGTNFRSTQSALALELQLGAALKAQRRHAEALERLDRARSLGTSRDVMIERTNVLQHLGRFEEAVADYTAWLEQTPEDLPVHTILNEIHYRHRQNDRFLASFDVAERKVPASAALPAAKANFLLKTGRAEEARVTYERALQLAPCDAAALSGMGLALEALQDFEGARRAHERCIALHPGRGEALEDYASFLVKQGEPDHAQRLAEQAVRLRPTSQGAYAVLSLAYRAQQDAREEALNGYDDYVHYADLAPPDGYADMDAFNRDLDAYLTSVHPDEREYFTQTARGGSRIYDELFYNGHGLVDRLLPRILTAIQAYAIRLEGPADHPFVSRRGRGFRFSGSWSSRLGDCGYHVNHIHQKGWISACYYVALPDVVTGSTDRQGWIKFGEPSTDYGADFGVRRAIEPQPGRLVMFPSYMWHGTVPFHAPQTRTTIAFDIMPA
jgi:tetratricopeptide (TPR) repeat protein